MEDQRFDALVRTVAAGTSRRGALGVLAGGVVAVCGRRQVTGLTTSRSTAPRRARRRSPASPEGVLRRIDLGRGRPLHRAGNPPQNTQGPCNARKCSQGCCDGRTCTAGTSWAQCDTGGATCQACANGEICATPSNQCASCATQPGSRSARSTRISISMSAARPRPAVPATASPASVRSPVFAPGRSSVFLGRQRRSVPRMRIVISTSFPARPASSWGVERAARLAVPAMSAARNRVPSGRHGRRPGFCRQSPW